MSKSLKRLFSVCLALCLCVTALGSGIILPSASAISVGNPNYQLVSNPDLTVGTFVADYNVMDYGADNTGNNNNFDIFQSIIDKIASNGGGTMYIPAGRYKIEGTLRIRTGVAIRGDWTKPVKGQAIGGTILMAYTGRGGDIKSDPFIKMEPESGVMNVAIWYPEQDPNNIVSYSPAITMGCDDVWGNEFCNVKDVTFVNAYTGIQFSTTNGGASPIVNGIYGTTLKTAVDVDNIADVGRVDWVDLSPEYWAGSGLPNSPSISNTTYTNYMYNNSTGLVMRRNDWSYASYLNIEGYYEGYRADNSIAEPGNNPNGHNYDFTFTNCKNGIVINSSSYCGIMFTSSKLINCENGIVLSDASASPVQFSDLHIDASKFAIKTGKSTVSKLLVTQSTIARGNVYIQGGTFVASDCDFNNPTPQIFLGTSAIANFAGNRFKEQTQIVNNSLYDYNFSTTPVTNTDFPETIKVKPKQCSPAKSTLYVVTQAPYNAVANGNTDCSTAIQNALNDAGNNGGGIVYLPAGKYAVRNPLTVPEGVELKGATDLSSVPHGKGSILEVYTGRNSETGTAFISLKKNSGIRGLVIDYPEQNASTLNTDNILPYPYAIQGQGENVYIVNIGLRACWQGIDLYSYKCDNHYVDYMTGHVFKTGIRIGGGSNNGMVNNCQVNVIVYACGGESKFGSWPNSPAQGADNAFLYEHSYRNLEFMIIGDCTNQILFDDFHYGSKRGIAIQNDGNGGPQNLKALGLGIDAARQSIYLDSNLNGTYDFINTQIVALGSGIEEFSHSSYLWAEPNSNFNLTIHGIDCWGSPNYGIVMGENTGNVSIENANYDNMSASGFLTLNGGKLNISASNTKQTDKFLVAGSSANLSVEASVMDTTDDIKNGAANWSNNLSYSTNMSSGQISSNAVSRDGWSATASNNNGNAFYAIDGDSASRWDTSGSQVAGQWFILDTGKTTSFNSILLDIGTSTADAAAGYEIYVSNDGNNWGGAVASGTNGQGVISLGAQNARYVRILQTGSKGNYWSIHEIHLLNTSNAEPQFPAQPTAPVLPEDGKPFDVMVSAAACSQSAPTDGSQVSFYTTIRNIGDNATSGDIKVDFYLDGRLVETKTVNDTVESGRSLVVYSDRSAAAFFGSHSVKVMVSFDKSSLDSDSGNNTKKSRFLVD